MKYLKKQGIKSTKITFIFIKLLNITINKKMLKFFFKLLTVKFKDWRMYHCLFLSGCCNSFAFNWKYFLSLRKVSFFVSTQHLSYSYNNDFDIIK